MLGVLISLVVVLVKGRNGFPSQWASPLSLMSSPYYGLVVFLALSALRKSS